MGIPQIVMIILMTMSLTNSAIEHGKPNGEYNFWTSLIGTVIEVLILKWGGFWG